MTEPLLITCPDCSHVADATHAARGSVFACAQCSKPLPVPTGIFPPPPTFSSRATSIVIACAFLGCVSFSVLMSAPNFAANEARMRRAAAERWVRALCWAEIAHHETGPWLVVAGTPPEFAPTESAFQFSVTLDGSNGVLCAAHAKDPAKEWILRARGSANGVEDLE